MIANQEMEMDDLHEHASCHSNVSMTNADWRKVMADSLGDRAPPNTRERYQIYRDAGVPETMINILDDMVFYAALQKVGNESAD
jgi:hypothetical protein